MKSQLVVFILLSIVTSKLFVYQPDTLVSEFSGSKYENGIPFTIGNFGHVPYGRKMIAPLVDAEPEDACEPLSPYDPEDLGDQNPFIIIERGGCHFTKKVLNAQQVGAKMAIIVDNQVENIDNLTMGDDGFGDQITIPAIFVSQKDGRKLKNGISAAEKYEHVSLKIEFDTEKVENAKLAFWINIPNEDSYYMVREFDEVKHRLADKYEFRPNYQFFDSDSNSIAEEDCLGGGKYCALNHEGSGTGRDIVYEQLRQLCMFKVNNAGWWKYMEKFSLWCSKPQLYQQCGTTLQDKHNIFNNWDEVNSCVESSFDKASSSDRNFQSNSILDEQLRLARNNGISYFPGVVINNVRYKGGHENMEILEAVCSTIEEPPKGCDFSNKNNNINNGGNGNRTQDNDHIKIVLMICGILCIFFVIMIFIYKRLLRKEMTKDMNNQVNEMVSNYISFYENRDKN